MHKSKSRVHLQVEAMESRALLSALAPGSSLPVRNTVAADIGSNMEILAKQSQTDRVHIQNTTRERLVVTATLKVSTGRQPTITETIPANGSIKLFDFKRNVDAYIWIDVKQQGGPNPPKPLKDHPLGKPPAGYDGKLFQISASGGVFSVTA
jgi:hypothetical protein